MPVKTPFWPYTTSTLCSRCLRRAQNGHQIHRSFHNSLIRAAAPASTLDLSKGHAHLSNRTLISLSGQDASKFLQGLTTNKVDTHNPNPWYTAFLEAHGRVLWDAIIYPHREQNPWSCYIEIDSATTDDFIKHLRRHKLRSKVEIRSESSLGVWAAWGEPHTPASSPPSLLDPRLAALGVRRVEPITSIDHESKPETSPENLQRYKLHRYLHGVAEGPAEIIASSALPQESNFDHLNGIDFRKGCYLGQELTIRTQHTGVVRKRILPVQLYTPASSPPAELSYSPETLDVTLGADIKRLAGEGGGSKRSAGKILGSVGNVGLALCRLEMMTDLRVSAEGGSYKEGQEFCVGGDEGVRVKAFVPEWLRIKLEGERERKGID